MLSEYMSDATIPKYGAYSFSRIKLCPEQFKLKYIDREKESFSDTERKDLGVMTHMIFDYDLSESIKAGEKNWCDPADVISKFVPPESDNYSQLLSNLVLFRSNFRADRLKYVMSPEEKLGAKLDMSASSFDSQETWFRGIIDYHEIDESGRAIVFDYKNYPIIVDLKYGTLLYEQLMSYVCLLFANYPALEEAMIGIYFSEFGESRMLLDRNGNESIITRAMTNEYWKTIQRKMIAWERRPDFPARPSEKGCGYCGYHSMCSYLNTKPVDQGELITREKASEALEALTMLDARRKQLKGQIDSWVKVHGRLESPSSVLEPEETLSIDFDIKEILKSVDDPMDIADLININKTKLKKHRLKGVIEKCQIYKKSTRLSLKEKG